MHDEDCTHACVAYIAPCPPLPPSPTLQVSSLQAELQAYLQYIRLREMCLGLESAPAAAEAGVLATLSPEGLPSLADLAAKHASDAVWLDLVNGAWGGGRGRRARGV